MLVLCFCFVFVTIGAVIMASKAGDTVAIKVCGCVQWHVVHLCVSMGCKLRVWLRQARGVWWCQ